MPVTRVISSCSVPEAVLALCLSLCHEVFCDYDPAYLRSCTLWLREAKLLRYECLNLQHIQVQFKQRWNPMAAVQKDKDGSTRRRGVSLLCLVAKSEIASNTVVELRLSFCRHWYRSSVIPNQVRGHECKHY